MHRAASVLCLALSQAAHAGPPDLVLPVDCALGTDCYIQNYVDADASPGYADFTCAALSYDGHKGTDFAVPSIAAAKRGASVRAAAPGQVTATRDGVSDNWSLGPPDFPEGQDCGNGIVIDHGDGWETQYCHLAQGSIAVRSGQNVSAGEILGQIGMSGNTAFPHVHVSLRKEGKVVDPFDPSPDGICGATPEDQLWTPPIAYSAGGLLQAGFASGVPDFNEVKTGQADQHEISARQGALVLWVHLYGARAGDTLHMVIDGPNGRFIDHVETLTRTQAQVMRAAGRRLHADNTNPGPHRGDVTFMRNGQIIGRMVAQTTLLE